MNSLKSSPRYLILTIIALSGTPKGEAASPQVHAGADVYSSFLIDGAGTLTAWGVNASGMLGIESPYLRIANPTTVRFPAGVQKWRSISAESSSTYAIGDNGQLYNAGHLTGDSASYFRLISLPASVGGLESVAASENGWLGITTNGQLYGTLNNNKLWPPRAGATRWTQVKNSPTYPSSTSGQADIYALDNSGRVYGFFSSTTWFSTPTYIEIPIPAGATRWTNIIVGNRCSVGLANDGNLYGWGANECGPLGLGFRWANHTNLPHRVALPAGKTGWKEISAGWMHTLATTTDGQLFACGYNSKGRLGLTSEAVPDLYDCFYNFMPVPNMTNVTSIAAGREHSLAIADCQVWTWGRNTEGQLGIEFESEFYPLPIAPLLTSDICSTNPPALPVVSIAAPDASASQGTWRTRLGAAPTSNTGRIQVTRATATAFGLEVKISASGTASSGVDYVALPASVTIPAYSNSVAIYIQPTGSTLAVNPATVVVDLAPDAAYQFGNQSDATVTLIQYEVEPPPPTPPVPVLTLQLFIGTNSHGQAFTVQSSTNLINWTDHGIGTNVWGVVTVAEPNRTLYRQRFFRVIPFP